MTKHLKPAVLAIGLAAGCLACPVQAADAGTRAAARTNVGVPEDWSSRALVIGNPLQDPDPARLAKGTELRGDAGYRDPRYLLAQVKRLQAMFGAASAKAPSAAGRRTANPYPDKGADGTLLRDWSKTLGGGANGFGGSGVPGVYPAKYTFDVFAAPDCDKDFVVYGTNAPGASGPIGSEYVDLTFTGQPRAGQLITLGNRAPRQVTLTASTTDNTGAFFQIGASPDETARNLEVAVNRWRGTTGIRSLLGQAQNVVRMQLLSAGNATFNLVNNITLSGVVSPLTQVDGTGSPAQPTIVAFNRLYKPTCTQPYGGNQPRVMWSYNTGDGYRVETSPVLSYRDDGKQVAFVQRNGDTLQLVLLNWQNWATSTGTATEYEPVNNATPLASVNASGYAALRGGSSAVMHVITFAGTSNIGGARTRSSPYVDYASDTLWVGDGNGYLHKFTGVFQGTPQEVVGGGFPAPVAPGLKLSSPVAYAGQVYVGSQSGGAGVGGKLHRVDAATGAVVSTAKLAADNSTGVLESPVVTVFDNGARVFAFVFNDGSNRQATTCSTTAGQAGCRLVAQFAAGFAPNGPPNKSVLVGRGFNNVSTLYAGGFNEDYYSSSDGTGTMYIVGGQPRAMQANLWEIPLQANTLQAPIARGVLGDTCGGSCATDVYDFSPVSVFKSGGKERLYVGIGKLAGRYLECRSGDCLFMYETDALSRPKAALATFGGTGGIIIDNVGGSTGAAQVYFAHGGNADGSGNAVQASQAALD